MHSPTPCTARLHTPRGFTLVEVLVSAAVLLVGVLGLVAVLVKAGELEVSDRHRRRARELIDSCMEQWTVMPTCDFDSIPPILPPSCTTVVIDDRDPNTDADDLTGWLTIDTSSVNLYPDDLGPPSVVSVPYRRVRITVNWVNPAAAQHDTMMMEKWVTDLQ